MTQQLIDLANKELTDRELETLSKERVWKDGQKEFLNTLVSLKSDIHRMQSESETKQKRLEKLKIKMSQGSTEVYNESRRLLLVEIEKSNTELGNLNRQKAEKTKLIDRLLKELKGEREALEEYELACKYNDFDRKCRQLELSNFEKQDLIDKFGEELESSGHKTSAIGIEMYMKTISDKAFTLQQELDRQERSVIEQKALLAKNERTKKGLDDENQMAVQKIRTAMQDQYPSNLHIGQRYREVKDRIKLLEKELECAYFAKTEFLSSILEVSRDKGNCLLCDGAFDQDVYLKRRLILEKKLKGNTPEEIKNIEELGEFREEFDILSQHKQDIYKYEANEKRIEEIDQEIEGLYNTTGKTHVKIQLIQDAIKKEHDKISEMKDLQSLILKEEELTEYIEANKGNFKNELKDRLLRVYGQGIPNQKKDPMFEINDTSNFIQIIEHEMERIEENLKKFQLQLNQLNLEEYGIEAAEVSEETGEQLESSVMSLTKEIERREAEIRRVEEERERQLEELDKDIKRGRSVISTVNYLLPELQKKHDRFSMFNKHENKHILENYSTLKALEVKLVSRGNPGLCEERDHKHGGGTEVEGRAANSPQDYLGTRRPE